MKNKLSDKELKDIYLLFKAYSENVVEETSYISDDDPEIINQGSILTLLLKISGMLPPNLIKRLDFSILARKYGDWNRYPDPEILDIIDDCFESGRAIEIEYFSMGSKKISRRRLNVFAHNARYVVGFCHNAGEIRKFRKSRIISAKGMKEKYKIPRDFEKKEYL